jgi:predicted metal-dependent hydrolase
VSKKSREIAERIARFQGRNLDAHYLGYFDCFNDQLFYESHDVLEELWLADRHGPNGDFFKGLIQLAGAFVHLQKNRLRPAAALFKLARTNLNKYPASHEQLNVLAVRRLIETWLGWLEGGGFEANPLREQRAPRVELELEAGTEGESRAGQSGQERPHYLKNLSDRMSAS